MNGEVKSFSPKHGYGFIVSDEKEYWFHVKSWGLRLPPAEGIRVSFDPVTTPKGLRARNVKEKKA